MNTNIYLQNGLVIWFTGLSGAGKSTLSNMLNDEISNHVKILDGDEVRENLSSDLDFSKGGRSENIRRISYVSKCIVDCSGIVIVAAISPYLEDRKKAKDIIGRDRFFEIFVDCSIEKLIERDVKGLYAKAISGEIKNFTGISDPYEKPESYDCYVDTGNQSVEESMEIIKKTLKEFLESNTSEYFI